MQQEGTQSEALANAAQVDASEKMGFTATGAEKAAGLIANSGKHNAAIRVFVKSGGCSGYQYGMAIEDRYMAGDRLFEDQGVQLVVDERSWPLLRGSLLDYVENMMGGGFSVENPNASSNCGCGHSFRTDGRAAPQGPDDSCS
ncbi:MAG: iron-sulfur cluster assembly accessory protein [Trueperaceae bacterium]